MENFLEKSEHEIKAWLSKNKVCFVTNTRCMPGSLYLATLKTYINKIPLHNLWIIPGEKDGKPFYGVFVYIEMLRYMLSNKHFDYVIYIDEDCFITDFNALIQEFYNFVESGCCLAGPQDGGVFCHRNHAKLMINTFLSFWNIKMLREKNIDDKKFFNYITTNIGNQDNIYKDWIADMFLNHKDLYEQMNKDADIMIDNVKNYRFQRFPNNGETEYAETVKDDKNNPIEPHQIPYSSRDNEEARNFEPYYIVEQALICLTETPIYYLFATDFYDEDYKDTKMDLSGLTSSVMARNVENEFNDHTLIAVHSWYSRAYTKWPRIKIELDHTKRINTLIKNFSEI